ncbi:hybrid sensor histidine kinase/response regulator transcription factor [Desertivirga xinjiangensis]|uniref:hybrid sensor histidine kinase/response regulator transcription factor n=1 Tax=Desertivirga xinjiangensis TaxID=539206 RepID=UPI00210EE03E|nr:hybrid sensor histidine kinase/response regulator transcription factor [Pedobacter xinjiangensis]
MSINDGLSQNTIFSMHQDTKGFIWIGTEDGLNRYDGYEFKVFKNELNNKKSLANNQVNVIAETSGRTLLIGTTAGISIYNPQTEDFSNISIQASGKDVQSANFVTAIVPENDHLIWIGTYDGLKLYDLVQKKLLNNNLVNTLSKSNIQVLYKDNADVLWIGLRNDLKCINLKTDKFVPVPSLLQKTISANPGTIRVIKQDQKGNIWLGSEQSGLFYYNAANNSCINYRYEAGNMQSLPVNVVRDIFFNDDGHVWLATRKGLSILDPAIHKFTTYTHEKYDPESLSHRSVLKIMRDRDGSIWVGTFAGGLNIYNPVSLNFQNIGEQLGNRPGLNNPVVSSILHEADGALWIGTEGGGLNFLNRSTGKYEFYNLKKNGPQSSENIVKSLARDLKGNIWVGAFDGLYYFNVKTKTFTDYTLKKDNDFRGRSQVYTVLAESTGVWAGTNGGGLLYFDPVKGLKSYVHDPVNQNSISGNNITSLVKDRLGNLWVGTLQGLCYLDRKQNKFLRYVHEQRNPHSITNNSITSLFIDSSQRLWIGTRAGLNFLNAETKQFIPFSEKEGLANNVIRAINEDRMGNIWVSSNRGISRIQLAAGRRAAIIKNYSISDGLQSNQFLSGASYRMDNGELLFGGINGITTFFPEKIRSNKRVPTVQFTDFLINSKRVPIGTKDSPQNIHINESRNITLAYNQAYITFKFAALSYINSEKNQYAYKLKGFLNDDWHYVGNQRTATYTNLSAGTYEFLVKSANNDGLWNEAPARIFIRVLPPWYKTWWAYACYLAVFCTLLYFFYYFSYKTAKLKSDLDFEQMSREKDQELVQRKLKFFTHISHEIKTPLTLILSPIEKLMSLSSLDNKVQHQLRLIYRNGERLMRLTNQLLDYRKLETGNIKLEAAEGDMIRFTREMLTAFQTYAKSKDIELKLITEAKSVQLWFDRDKMEKVIFNLISNSLKFTPAGGYIHVKLNVQAGQGQSNKYLKIEVQDNGVGIPPENLGSLFKEFQNYNHAGVNNNGTGLGLSFSKGLVELHGGSIEAQSILGENGNENITVFRVTLPLGREHLNDSDVIQNYNGSENINAYLSHELPVFEKTTEKKESILTMAGERRFIMLLVEDNPDVMDFMAAHFERDFEVITAADGAEGWERAIKAIPDIIISDVMMPNLTGTELCSQLKVDPRTSHIPVILLTAREPMLFKIEGLETGADDYITKPFHLPYLDLKVWNLIESRIKLREKYSREITLQPTNVAITSPDEKFLEKAMKHIEENISEPSLGVEELSRVVGMSKTTLYRKIKALTNQNTNEFIRSVRLNRAAQLLSQNKFNISEIAYQVGFTNQNYFRKCFKEQFGSTPSDYIASKQNQEGEVS